MFALSEHFGLNFVISPRQTTANLKTVLLWSCLGAQSLYIATEVDI